MVHPDRMEAPEYWDDYEGDCELMDDCENSDSCDCGANTMCNRKRDKLLKKREA